MRGPMTLTPIVEYLALELSLPVLATSVCRVWDSNTQPSTYEANALTDCTTSADFFIPIWAVHFEKENNIDAARRKMVIVIHLVVYLSTMLKLNIKDKDF